jgi:photosynthetic reaction center cytochrome c subunit
MRRPLAVLALSLITAVATSHVAADAAGQADARRTAPLAEATFKNVQLLRGIPVDEFMDTMGMFSAATGLNCANCHALDTVSSGNGWEGYAVETPLKQTARRMLRMVNALNKDSFGGTRTITCNTCHRGDQKPKPVPSLAIQYSSPVEDPNDVVSFPSSGIPSAESIFAKYVDAVGGRARVDGLRSSVSKGTYSGYDTDQSKVPVEIFSKAPASKTTIVHARLGDSVRTCDGAGAWIASPDRPLLLMALTGGNLIGARIDALLSFPSALKPAAPQWRVAVATLEDRDVYVLQGVLQPRQPPLNLYFDQESGLLVRALRFADTAVGRVPTQIDFADYRDVGGLKLPFKLTTTWTDGQSTVELTDVQVNVPIDAERFRQPAPAAPLK